MYYGERFNVWIYLIGVVVVCIGVVWLMVQVSFNGSLWKIVGVGVYGVILMLFYSILIVYYSVCG